MQTKTVTLGLRPTNEQKDILDSHMKEYIRLKNEIVETMVTFNEPGKLTTAKVSANLPANLKNQAIQDAKSIFGVFRKTKKEPVIKKLHATWNNCGYKIAENEVYVVVSIDGKSQRIKIKANIKPEILDVLKNSKLGTLRIRKQNNVFVAQVAISLQESTKVSSHNIMGVDLGIKIPSVCVCEDSSTRFCGNGRQTKFMRRKFASHRKKLQKSKKNKAIKKMANKEQRWMKDQNHKISRQIINFAKSKNIGVINLEQLKNIRRTTSKSRKNNRSLHSWAFYQLQSMITYKANMAGITVNLVNPAYTSQICPICGEKNHATDRQYNCSCGYSGHRDRVGALNIIKAPVMCGNSTSA